MVMGLPQVVWERHHLEGEKQVCIHEAKFYACPCHNTGVVFTCSDTTCVSSSQYRCCPHMQ